MACENESKQHGVIGGMAYQRKFAWWRQRGVNSVL